LARQDGFDKDVGPLGFFVLDFGPLVKKVGHPCNRVIVYTMISLNQIFSEVLKQ
jgi:hypothetical protein